MVFQFFFGLSWERSGAGSPASHLRHSKWDGMKADSQTQGGTPGVYSVRRLRSLEDRLFRTNRLRLVCLLVACVTSLIVFSSVFHAHPGHTLGSGKAVLAMHQGHSGGIHIIQPLRRSMLNIRSVTEEPKTVIGSFPLEEEALKMQPETGQRMGGQSAFPGQRTEASGLSANARLPAVPLWQSSEPPSRPANPLAQSGLPGAAVATKGGELLELRSAPEVSSVPALDSAKIGKGTQCSAGVHSKQISQAGSTPASSSGQTKTGGSHWKETVSRIAGCDGSIIATQVDFRSLPLVDSWFDSIASNGYEGRVVFIADDEDAFKVLSKKWPEHTVCGDEFLQVGPDAANKATVGAPITRRPFYLQGLLQVNVDVLFSDVNTLWLNNPYPYFEAEHDVMAGEENLNSIASGKIATPKAAAAHLKDALAAETFGAGAGVHLIMAKASVGSRQLMKLWADNIQKSPGNHKTFESVVRAWNEAVQQRAKHKASVPLLPSLQFPSRCLYYGQGGLSCKQEQIKFLDRLASNGNQLVVVPRAQR